MKFFICTVLAIGIWSQLCAASADHNTDKRYPIFDALLKKAYELNSMQILIPLELFSNAWPKFNEAVANDTELGLYGTEEFQGFSKAMTHFLEIAKQFKEDNHNCELQNMAEKALKETMKFECAYTFERFDNMTTRMEQRYKEIIATLFTDTVAKLSEGIMIFEQSLNDKEREQYKDFLVVCEKFLQTDNEVEKYNHYEKIVSTLDDFKIPSDNCEMDSSKFMFFSMAIAMNAERFMTPENLKLYEQNKSEDKK